MSKFRNRSGEMNLEERMKQNYEHAYRIQLPKRMPVILRLDGKAFHTFTRHMNKPFDTDLILLMQAVMQVPVPRSPCSRMTSASTRLAPAWACAAPASTPSPTNSLASAWTSCCGAKTPPS